MSQHHQGGRRRQERRRKILEATTVCHICGQPGSDAVDHVIPISRGGSDEIGNLKPAHHDVPPYCNRRKADLMPTEVDRKVVLICGPPGAGKSTLAHSFGLDVYDLDDDRWGGSDPLFRAALVELREQPQARAVVIRSAPTLAARQKAASLCGATDCTVIETPLDVCIVRIRERGRTMPPMRVQIRAARDWWSKYEPGPVKLSFATLRLRRSGSLA